MFSVSTLCSCVRLLHLLAIIIVWRIIIRTNKRTSQPNCYIHSYSLRKVFYLILRIFSNTLLMYDCIAIFSMLDWISKPLHMSHFAYACKMRCPLNLVLEKSEYLWFYWTFCIVILDYGLKLHKLSNHTLVMLQKWLEIHLIIVWSSHCVLFSAIFATEKFQKKMSTLSLKLNYWSPRHQTAVFKVLISFKCS